MSVAIVFKDVWVFKKAHGTMKCTLTCKKRAGTGVTYLL